MKKKMRKAFRKGRRSSMVLDFQNSNLAEIIELFYWKIFFRKNIYTHKIWNKNCTKSKIRLFAFRNRENLEKYLREEKLNYAKNLEEKTRLMGEALGYPDFAVEDFTEISAKKNPNKTRLNFLKIMILVLMELLFILKIYQKCKNGVKQIKFLLIIRKLVFSKMIKSVGTSFRKVKLAKF